MQDLRQRPLFICGHHRSGTSLLLALLDGHPELIVGVGESRFFKHFLPKAANGDAAMRMAVARKVLLKEWYSENNYYQLFLSHVSHEAVQEIYTELMASGVHNPADYLTNSIFAYATVTDQVDAKKKYWVDKTPRTEHYTRFIFDWWERPRCIHMLRDPRDVYATFKRRAVERERRVPALAAVVHRWQESERLLRHNTKTYGGEHYLSLRYEDLAMEPEKTLQRVTSFLDIEDHPTLRWPTRGGGKEPWKGNAVEKQFTGISSSNIGRWRSYLEQDEVVQVETILHEAMCRQGYTPEFDTSWKDRVRVLPLHAANAYRGLRGKRQHNQLLKAYDVSG